MSTTLHNRLRQLAAQSDTVLSGGRRGIEKESLRITPDGLVAATPHPAAFGSALTNHYITTDYSEALLEFVTPPETSTWSAMQFLCDIHQFVYASLEDELLWPFSMPCRLRSDDDIPLARYGSSNIGRMKTIYRNGLGLRYGRFMQVISGIHFNYSLPDEFWLAWGEVAQEQSDPQTRKSDAYMGLVRNVRRLDWLLLYLFGASPAACKSFLQGRGTDLELLGNGTCYGEWATSLRMSDLGYQNTNQASLYVSANSVEDYIRDLSAAVATPNENYVQLGVKDGSGYLQLNANQLQIENEYYSSVRPKRVARSGERPTHALRRGGVEYVELRVLDVSPLDPAGISQAQQKFLEAFLIYCLLEESPPISPAENETLRQNRARVAREGRRPGLELVRDGRNVSLAGWAAEIVADMQAIGELLDHSPDDGYAATIAQQLAVVGDAALTPSARILDELRQAQLSFAEYGLQVAREYADYFASLAPELNRHRDMLQQESRASVQQQAEVEAADDPDFDGYLQRYFS